MKSEKRWLNCARTRLGRTTAGSEEEISQGLPTCRHRTTNMKDLRATFGTRLAEAGCDAFTIAQLLGHSDVRVTMRYVRSVEETKRAAVQAIKLSSRKSVHKLATNEI